MQKVLLLICIGWIGTAAAQEKKQLPKFQYRTITQIGLLAGSTTEGATLQLIGGVKNRRLFTGIGTGLDFYMYRGIPLFADIRYDVLKKKGILFVYADGGIHFPWEDEGTDGSSIKYFNGLYTDAGLGYQFKSKTSTAFLLSIGYMYKHVKQEYNNLVWIDPWPVRPSSTVETRNYYLNRVAVKMGIQF
jgi:hypothetical protein